MGRWISASAAVRHAARRGRVATVRSRSAVATVLPRRNHALRLEAQGRRLTPLGVLHGATGLAAAEAVTSALPALAGVFPGPVGVARRGHYAFTVEAPLIGAVAHLACPPPRGGFLLLHGPLNLPDRTRERAASALTRAFCHRR
mgnify:FL=1